MRYKSTRINIYPVGLFYDLRIVRGTRRQYGNWSAAKQLCRFIWNTPIRFLRKGWWRDAKNYFNGYLAEHLDGATSAGHGWTRNRAVKSLRRIRRKVGHNL